MALSPRGRILLSLLTALVIWGCILQLHQPETPPGYPEQSKTPEIESITALVADLSRSMKPTASVTADARSLQEAIPTSDNSSPAPSGALDTEWAAFPRSKIDIGNYLASMPEDISGHLLWRHVLLNPEDTYVPGQLRETLETTLVQLREPFRRFTEAQNVASRIDHDSAIHLPAAELRLIPSQDEDGKIRIRPDGVGVLTKRDGKYYAVPAPTFDRSLEHGHFIVVESAAGIVGWFQATGLCDKSSGDLVMAQAFAAAQYKNRMWKK